MKEYSNGLINESKNPYMLSKDEVFFRMDYNIGKFCEQFYDLIIDRPYAPESFFSMMDEIKSHMINILSESNIPDFFIEYVNQLDEEPILKRFLTIIITSTKQKMENVNISNQNTPSILPIKKASLTQNFNGQIILCELEPQSPEGSISGDSQGNFHGDVDFSWKDPDNGNNLHIGGDANYSNGTFSYDITAGVGTEY
jgi:hypothetical protein